MFERSVCRRSSNVTGRVNRGFSIVELLVVIGVIGVLVSLLIPAVQAAREAGRRNQCSGNLRQIGLAMLNYEQTYKVLPPQAIYVADGSKSYKYTGAATLLLPYFEQQKMAEQWNYGFPWCYQSTGASLNAGAAGAVANGLLSQQKLPIFLCPSAPPSRMPAPDAAAFANRGLTASPYDVETTGANYPLPLYGYSDYFGCQGLDPTFAVQYCGYPPSSVAGQGVFGKDMPGVFWHNGSAGFSISLALIADGASRTLGWVEDAGRPELYYGSRISAKNLDPKAAGLTESVTVDGWGWADADLMGVIGGAAVADLPACGVNCTNDSEIYAFHPRGANAVFVDGSAHFISEDISNIVLGALVTIRGQEVVATPE